MRLDAGHDPPLLQHLREHLAGGAALLVHRLRVQNGATEVLVGARGLEEHLAVLTARLLRVLDAHLLEAAAHGTGPFVAGRDALPGRGDGHGSGHELLLPLSAQMLAVVHLDAHLQTCEDFVQSARPASLGAASPQTHRGGGPKRGTWPARPRASLETAWRWWRSQGEAQRREAFLRLLTYAW
eukprot:scaffold7362_cov266-Pinguiococcus_pyrenoidosus.AAC.9